MGVSLIEQETTISFSRTGKQADIWTSDMTMCSKLDRLCEESPEYYKCIEVGKSLDGELVNKRYLVSSKKLISLRARPAAGRVYTEEEKAVLRERLKKMRDSKRRKERDGAEAEQ